MELLYAGLTAFLVGTGVYLLLSRAILRVVLGLAFVSYGVNLAILAAGGLRLEAPPLLSVDGPYVDPLPQALILTAIVIGFGTTALLLTLAVRTHRATGKDDVAAFEDELQRDAVDEGQIADPEHPTNPELPPDLDADAPILSSGGGRP